jgi:preprotein translocase subunit SecA
MAGRGTDILLGGNPGFMARRELRQQGYSPEIVTLASEKVLPRDIAQRIEEGRTDEYIDSIVEAREKYRLLYQQFKELTDKEHEEVVALGGLHVLGTERHEARRIDNQLRGRAGRQGDPGSSRFHLSLEDELMRLFGGDMLTSMMDKMGFSEDEPIAHSLVTKAVETAQKRIEAHNFAIRKNVVEYDNVLNKQREVIYSDRRGVLESEAPGSIVSQMADRVIQRAMDLYWPPKARKEEADLHGLAVYARDFLPDLPEASILEAPDRTSLADDLLAKVTEAIDAKAGILGEDTARFQRFVLLRVIDRQWVDQLRTMEDLREGIGLQAYGQKDPLVEYTRLGYEMFQGRIQTIEETVVKYLCRVEFKREGSSQVVRTGGAMPDRTRLQTSGPSDVSGGTKKPVARSGQKKVGRNDPCPCGSGKKYKNCCGKIA